MSICSLISPATAISKTQDRADTSVWWKFPFSIFFIIYYVQSAIINQVCKPELWLLCSAHPIIVLYIRMKFHENISNDFEDIECTHVYGGNGHFQYSKSNNSKSRKTRVTVHVFCMSSHRVNICVKFHENMSSDFKVLERTQKLLTDTHTQKRKLHVYTPLHAYFVCRGYNQSYGSCVLQVVSWFNICVTFHESMSSGF